MQTETSVDGSADTPPANGSAEELPDTITSADIKAVFLGGLFLLVSLAACYVASEIILPVMLAFVLMLVFRPVMRFFEKLHLPRAIGALAIIIVIIGSFVVLGAALSGPIASWGEKIPAGLPRLQERLTFLSGPIKTVQTFLHQAENLTQGEQPAAVTVAVKDSGLNDKVLSATRAIASGLFTTVLVLFFLLIAGDTFLRRLVEVLPRFKDKRLAVNISQQVEADISAYLVTITLMNAAMGAATGILVGTCGIGDPLLWGTVAFLLNYVPILGPTIGVITFIFVGLLSIETLWLAFVPAGVYLLIHIIEGETITPLLLAKRFTLNPVLVILAVVFWYWMWGVAGAILAVPMLAIVKIICDGIQPLAAFGHFIEG